MPDFHLQPVTRLHQSLGAVIVGPSKTRFCVWSPTSQTVEVDFPDLQRRQPMEKTAQGYHHVEIDDVGDGDRYRFCFDDGPPIPDPASRFQPDGVHGPSQIIRSDFGWTDSDWRPPNRKDWIIYELHLGTFTQQGTYRAAIDRLDDLVELGITAIELMPLADSAGRWNWGYDGVCLFAPNRNYGTPDDLKSFVNAAHDKGLSVFLDVVYNHLGPEGNYLGQAGPYLSAKHHTPWGPGPNFDHPQHGPQLRRWFIANAIFWIDEYHFDGLRVDAIHCIADDRDPHFVIEMAQAVDQWNHHSERHAALIAESNVYDPEVTRPIAAQGCGFDAQWSDCFLHSVFAVVRPDEQLCHREYQSPADLDQVLRTGYVYTGTLRQDFQRTTPTDRVETRSLIYSIQNHDFIGNHPLGKRLHRLTSPATQRAAATLMILSPAIPMLFMGEEFASENDFAFFVDFSEPFLRQSVIEGRRREYPQHDWSRGYLPTDEQSFQRSKIGPIDQGDRSMFAWYCQLIATRKAWLASGLLDENHLEVSSDLERGIFVLNYGNAQRRASVLVRLTDPHRAAAPIPLTQLSHLVATHDGEIMLDSLASDSPTRHLHPNHGLVLS